MNVRITRNTSASGVSLAAGTVLAVPKDLSEPDARVLVRLGKAVIVPPTEAAKSTKAAETEESPTPAADVKSPKAKKE